MTILYDIFCNIWWVVGSIAGMLALYGLLSAVFDQRGGGKH